MTKAAPAVPFSNGEMEVVRSYAKRRGISEEDAASELASNGIARRVQRRTGKRPAKVYTMKKKK